MMIVIRVQHDDSIIREAKFSTYGCPVAVACGEWIVEAAVDKSLDEAMQLTEAELVAAIGSMPLGRDHCPGLAVNALKDAVRKLTGDS